MIIKIDKERSIPKINHPIKKLIEINVLYEQKFVSFLIDVLT